MNFQKLGIHPDLLRGVQELGFTRPTPIQEKAIPPAMAGKDVLACAMTGSGKSAAFLLPILHRLMGKKRGTTRALILTPTRELAAQIDEHLKDLAMHTPITGAAIYGGVGLGPQEHALRSGVDIVVATPGRLLDHMRHPYTKFGALEVLVFDEADRMLDMGFLPDIKKIVRMLPAKRQTLFFSATMPAPIGKLAQEWLNRPETIDVERRSGPAVGITQAVYPVPQSRKGALLLTLLETEGVESALVFTRTKHRANKLARFLELNRVITDRIHGNRSQSQRTKALEMFKSGKFRVLVATDIAARGIDVTALSHVINFDVPVTPEDYIHRVGRTGRAEMTGDAFTFVAPEEEGDLRAIEKVLSKRLPRVTLPEFSYEPTAEPKERREERSRGPRSKPAGGSRAGGSRASGGGSRPTRSPVGTRPGSHRTGPSQAGPAKFGGPSRGPSSRPAPRAPSRPPMRTALPQSPRPQADERRSTFGSGVDSPDTRRGPTRR